MHTIPLEKITDGIYYLALKNTDVECVLSDGRLDMASVLHGVPNNSTLLIEHKSGHAAYNKYLSGNKIATNFKHIGYILSGSKETHSIEMEHFATIKDLYSDVEPFHNYGEALEWAQQHQ